MPHQFEHAMIRRQTTSFGDFIMTYSRKFLKIAMAINWLWLIGLTINPSYAQGVSLFINKNSFAPGDQLELGVAASGLDLSTTHADVYIAVQLPDGSIYYLTDLRKVLFADASKIIPLITAWQIVSFPQITLLSFTIPPRIPSGTYKWYLTLVTPGTSVEQPTNWIANDSIELAITSNWFDFDSEEAMDGKTADSLDDDMALMIPSPAPPGMPTTGGETSTSSEYIPTTGMAEPEMSSGATPTMPTETSKPDTSEIPIDDEVRPTPFQSNTLTAGDIDDNLNFTAFQRYLNQQLQQNDVLPTLKIADRITLNIRDAQGRSVSNAKVTVSANKQPLLTTYAATNGRVYLLPTFEQLNNSPLELQITPPADELGSPNTVLNTTLDLQQLNSQQELTLTFPNAIAALPKNLDIMLVIDTTGSMGDEMDYLTIELRDIISAVHEQHPQVHIRFGLTVYRDVGDIYVVKEFDFTDSLNQIQQQLSKQYAGGGGDYPEAMEQAMAKAVSAQWRQGNTAKMLFLIADAPPHDENLVTMMKPIQIARQQGIRIYSLAASGVGDTAEFMLRTAAMLTQGRYLFLTDDSGVGSSHAEPTVPCYVVTHLSKLMSRMIISELSGTRIEPEPADILRTTGNYQAGICQPSTNQQ
jgi:hypothetical protein